MTRHYAGPHGCGGPEGGWVCGNIARTQNEGGETERDAEMAYAARHGIEHWARKEWDAAMAKPSWDFDA